VHAHIHAHAHAHTHAHISRHLHGSTDPIATPLQAVRNFVQLCLEGYYDGSIFHRVIRDFMAQTGDPTGTGTGAPGFSIQGSGSLTPWVRTDRALQSCQGSGAGA
jgi:cyclophilin family peptidyl-prolyl cis-trans isomerase